MRPQSPSGTEITCSALPGTGLITSNAVILKPAVCLVYEQMSFPTSYLCEDSYACIQKEKKGKESRKAGHSILFIV